MTQQTITALFDSRNDAMKAVSALEKAGIPRTSIRMTPESETATSSTTTTRTSYDTESDERGFWASLGDMFMPDDDRHVYAQAMHRGSIMVAVTTDEAHAQRAEDILEEHGTVDIDEREMSYRKEGLIGAAGARAATGTTGVARRGKDEDEVIQVAEERLNVGKRQVGGGKVRVRSYVVETPVSEQVSLRKETINVERRPVDRAVVAGEDAFKERTYEASASSEEAVVSKQTRVTGEVRLTKTAEDRTETVSDTVRSTEVEIDDDRVAAKKPAPSMPKR